MTARMLRIQALGVALSLVTSACQGDNLATEAPPIALEASDVVEDADSEDSSDTPPADEEVFPTLDGDFRVTSFTLEAMAMDVAAFDGKHMVVAGRKGDAVVVLRLDERQGNEVERLTLPRDRLSDLKVVRLGKQVVLMWVADGFLEALALTSETPLNQHTPQRLAAEEGGTLIGAPAIASHGLEQSLVCVGDSGGLLCLGLQEGLVVSSLYKMARSEKQEAVALSALADGYLLLSAACRNEACSRQRYEARTLSAQGEVQGRERQLPEMVTREGLIAIAADLGFILVGRRSSAGEHSAWKITDKRVDEISGTFSRVVGGLELNGEPILVERSHLKMRKGFPVTGYVLRHLPSAERPRQGRSKVERESFPDAVAERIPREIEQRVLSYDGHLIFTTMPRKGQIQGTIVRLFREGP